MSLTRVKTRGREGMVKSTMNQKNMEDVWQQKFLRFKELQEHIEQLTEHVEKLNTAVVEIENTKGSLQELQSMSTSSDLLAPIANGIFVQGTLTNTQKLLVNVGADTVVEKTVVEVIEMLQQQQQDIAHRITEAESILQGFHEEAMRIYREVEAAKE